VTPPEGWELVEGPRIRREFRFPDFVTAFGFMASCALVAERMGHHPNWSNVYGTVTVELWSHDVAAVTERDMLLAEAMNRLATGVGE
jgi:4a-hydroxytetrahydrobiopterin dehydratase